MAVMVLMMVGICVSNKDKVELDRRDKSVRWYNPQIATSFIEMK